MKRYLVLALIFTFLSINQESNAQLKYGAGANYSTWLNTPGINLRLEFPVFDELVAVPMVDINIPRFSTGTLLNGLSFHFHYNFEIVEELDLYPLAGATIKSYLDFDRGGSTPVYHRFSFNPTGGAGAKLKLSETFEVFAEGRLEIGRYSQFVSTFGVLLRPQR